MSLIKICQLRIEIVCRVKRGKIFWKMFCCLSVKRSNFGLRIWSRASKMNICLMFLIKICQLRIEIVCRVKRGKIFWKMFCCLSVKRSNLGLRIWSRASKMNIFLMFLIKICQLRIEIVCRAKWGKTFLKFFLLFECKKVQFGPKNIIWGLKNGG